MKKQKAKSKSVSNELSIFIVGTGMYVSGRGTDNHGVVLPAVYEWMKRGNKGKVYIAGTRLTSIATIRKKIKELNALYGFTIVPQYFPNGTGDDSQAYRKALRAVKKPACAVVVVPDNLRRQIAGDAIMAGRHTIVVKPLAPTVQ